MTFYDEEWWRARKERGFIINQQRQGKMNLKAKHRNAILINENI